MAGSCGPVTGRTCACSAPSAGSATGTLNRRSWKYRGPAAVEELLGKAGFSGYRRRSLSGGIARLHVAEKGREPSATTRIHRYAKGLYHFVRHPTSRETFTALSQALVDFRANRDAVDHMMRDPEVAALCRERYVGRPYTVEDLLAHPRGSLGFELGKAMSRRDTIRTSIATSTGATSPLRERRRVPSLSRPPAARHRPRAHGAST